MFTRTQTEPTTAPTDAEATSKLDQPGPYSTSADRMDRLVLVEARLSSMRARGLALSRRVTELERHPPHLAWGAVVAVLAGIFVEQLTQSKVAQDVIMGMALIAALLLSRAGRKSVADQLREDD